MNWEKCHFTEKEGIVFEHNISKRGIEDDRVKIKVIEKLLPPISVKSTRSFLRHVGFYKRFIKEFFEIANPLCKILDKVMKFQFDDGFLKVFDCLKEQLISTSIIVSPN